nr:uncharacterized protein LOC109184751 [Ipomoea batatas]
MKDMMNQQLETMRADMEAKLQAEMDAKLQAERNQMQTQMQAQIQTQIQAQSTNPVTSSLADVNGQFWRTAAMDGSNPRRAFSGVDGDWFSDQQQLLQA